MSKLIICITTSILCELIYMLIVLIGGKILNIETKITLKELIICIIDTLLIIILYCSVFNFVSMIFSEATISTIIDVIIFIFFFVMEMYVGSIAYEPKYFEEKFFDADGNETVISQYPNPNYPGDDKVEFAKTVELLIPVGQASMIFNASDEHNNTDEGILYKILLYSAIEICIINVAGIYIFSKKEIK